MLVDSEKLWDQARREVTSMLGGRWRDSATRDMQGMSAPEWSRYLHGELGVPEPPERISELVVEKLLARYRRSLPLLPGAVEAVRRIASRWPLGLASSANRIVIDEVVALAGLTDQFEVTVSSEEVPRGKPAPDVYLEAARRLGTPAADCAAIEDSANGIRSGAAAGMAVVAIPNREFPPPPEVVSSADAVIDDLDALSPELVAGLPARGASVPKGSG